jgi:hypothetical protein
MIRAGNTGREMIESGAWIKVARKHYRHMEGVEIVYNCNRWAWEIIGGKNTGEAYGLLWVARQRAEQQVAH